MKKIVVVGSANMDTTIEVERLASEFEPKADIIGKKRRKDLGGKGFNQARAIKLQNPEASVSFVGCIGNDKEGVLVAQGMDKSGLDTRGLIYLSAEGQPDERITDGRIIIKPDFVPEGEKDHKMIGEYGECIRRLTPDVIPLDELEEADILVAQMKMPSETVEFLINYAEEHGKPIIIDPTPKKNSKALIEKGLLSKATYLTPNEDEAFALIGYIRGKSYEEIEEEYKKASKAERYELIEELVRLCPNVIATLGEDGVIYNKGGIVKKKPTYPVKSEKTYSVGAGDTFNGGFIGALARGEGLDQAIKFGLMASSMKVHHDGAQNGVPTYEETKAAIIAYEKAVAQEVEVEED